MRLAIVILLAACSGSPAPATGDGPGGDDDGPPPDGSGGLVPGTLVVSWMNGSSNCLQNTDPEVQVHAYNTTTHIIRQNKCKTFEAPFIYVLEGTDSVLVFDTGATNTATLRDTVRGLIGSKPLLVAHSHAHGDHIASDSKFSGQAQTTLVATNRSAIQSTFGITTWPTDRGTIDLGGRILDVIAIPGHEAQHIALYDRQTGLLLTGDTLYPGFLFVTSWPEYHDSIIRLADFASAHPIAHVLGAHVEMTSTARQAYPYGTTFQPAEHVLDLSLDHVLELRDAVVAIGPATPNNGPFVHDDFIIDPQ